MKLSKNRILANADNRIASIGAAHHRPSTDLRLLSQSRTGGGRLEISGLFTGDADVVIEAEITSGTGGQLAARAQTQGVGSGTVRVDTIRDSAAPGTLRFALADSGDPATAATLDFYGATLAAKTEGESGNDLAITCQRALTMRPTHFSLLNPIAAGETELTGDEYDWGQPAGAAHTVPDGALRIQFAGHAQVHRAWKSWQDGRFVYHLSPAPELEIPTGTRVLAVTGDYTITVRNSTATEIYPACVTLYDFLAALQARSALVTVQSAVTADRAPGGMAATEIPLITDAHARPATGAPEGVTVEVAQVASGAGTENLTLRNIGGSRWSVTGALSGELGTARAGEPFSSSAITFTIYDKRISDAASASSNAATDARIRWKYNPTSRDKNEPLPTLCMKPIVRGINAVDKTVTFRYTKRPEKDCPCDDQPDLVLPAACLGLLTTGGLTMLPPDGNQRRGALFGWLAQFTAGNLLLRGENIDSDAVDIDLADACVKPLNAALEQIYNKASDETARDAALVIWDQAFEELKNDFAAYAAITRNDYGLWGEWEKGRQYVNTLNGHLYEVIQILADGDEIEAMIALGIWPARGKSDWKTDGSEFTLTASANQQQQAGTQTVTVTLQHLGAPLIGSGGTFVVGREITKQGYTRGNNGYEPDPARTFWKITSITLDGTPADSVQGFSTTDDGWLDTSQYDKWDGRPVSGTDASGKAVTVTFAPLDPLAAGQYVVGREVQNSTGTDCWRVAALTVGSAPAESARASLPSMADPAWLKDAADPATPGAEFTLTNAVADNTFAVTFKDLGPVPTGAFSLKDFDRLGRFGSTVGSNTSASATETSTSNKTSRTSESTSSSESSTGDDGKPSSSGSSTPWYQRPYYPDPLLTARHSS